MLAQNCSVKASPFNSGGQRNTLEQVGLLLAFMGVFALTLFLFAFACRARLFLLSNKILLGL